MGRNDEYSGMFNEEAFQSDEIKYFVVPPKTISQLVNEYSLSYPFVVEKISTNATYVGQVLFSLGARVTITKRLPSQFGYYASPSDIYYEGFLGPSGYAILDTPSWALFEKSDNNVVPLQAYKKFRDARALRIKKRS